MNRRIVRVVVLAFVVSCAIFAVYLLSIFDSVDDWAERRFIAYMDPRMDKEFSKDRIRIILAEEKPEGEIPAGESKKSHRKFHGELTRALAAANAKVVAFDVYFEDPTEFDTAFGNAIADAEREETYVVVGVNTVKNGSPERDPPDYIKNAVKERWGDITIGGQPGATKYIRVVKLASHHHDEAPPAGEQDETPLVPSFALQTFIQQAAPQRLAAFYSFEDGRIRLRLNGRDGEVVKSIPVSDELDLLVDYIDRDTISSISRTYREVYENRHNPQYMRDYDDKIVLVGYMNDELRAVSESEQRYGIEIQANVVSNILNDLYIYRLGPMDDFLLIFGIAVVGVYTQILSRGRMDFSLPVEVKNVQLPIKIPVPPIAISLIYLFCAFWLYKQQRVLLNLPYHLTALFTAYWLGRAARSKKLLDIEEG